ncbi:MAG: RNA 2',3'-cyclic phosphodiesterase [Pseudomonadota bacterium]
MRSFIAITLPDAVVEQLEDLQDGLRGATWSLSETFHITLAFLGDQPRRTLEDVDSHLIALDATAFDLTLASVGVFGQTRASRSVHALVAEASPLSRLQAKVETAVRAASVPLESRRYIPHVTLGRWKRGEVRSEELGAYLADNMRFKSDVFKVSRFTLFHSELGRSGAVHTALAEYELSANSARP